MLEKISDVLKSIFESIFIVSILAGTMLIISLVIVFCFDTKAETDSTNSTLPTPTISATPTQQPTMTVEPLPVESNIISLPLPKTSTGVFKSYEKYTSITDKTSKQYYFQKLCFTDEQGFRRFNNRYVVAMGTFYGQYIGQEFTITFEGRTIEAILGDFKADEDTINRQYCKQNKSIVEFIIDPGVISKDALNNGDISRLGFKGKVLKIEREK